jgi:hypothetical protein
LHPYIFYLGQENSGAPTGAGQVNFGQQTGTCRVITRGGAKTSQDDVGEPHIPDKGGKAPREGEGGGPGDRGTKTQAPGGLPTPKGKKQSSGRKFWKKFKSLTPWTKKFWR